MYGPVRRALRARAGGAGQADPRRPARGHRRRQDARRRHAVHRHDQGPDLAPGTLLLRRRRGSGQPATVEGPTPLGAVADAARNRQRLRPLLITDEFSFGLGVCGIGGAKGDDSHFWNVRVNHVALQVGGDQFTLDPGDQVLWTLVPNPVCEPTPPYSCQPGPPELRVKAPARAEPGRPFVVRVFEWSDSGKRSAAVGVTVTGAAAPTDAQGETTVILTRTRKLTARRAGAIASAERAVCVAEPVTLCPRLRGRILVDPAMPSRFAAPGAPTGSSRGPVTTRSTAAEAPI